MFCGVCGKENQECSLFCEHCGSELSKGEPDSNYDEVIEQLKFEGYNILSEEEDLNNKSNKNFTRHSNNSNKPQQRKNNVVNNIQPNVVKNQSKPNPVKQNTAGLNFDNKNNKRDYKNNMGQVVIDTNKKKKKNTVAIVICIVLLVLIIVAGIGAIVYYFLNY